MNFFSSLLSSFGYFFADMKYATQHQPREFLYEYRKCFATRLLRNIIHDTDITFRIIAIIFGISHLGGFRKSSHIRFFVSICLIWSVVLTGAFTVEYSLKLKLFTLHLLPIIVSWSSSAIKKRREKEEVEKNRNKLIYRV